MMCSIILQGILVREIGLYLDGLLQSPDFKIGIAFANFLSSGICENSKEAWKRHFNFS